MRRSSLLASFALLGLFAGAGQAQEPTVGRVTGRIIDAATGQGITSVSIQIVGTTLGANSGVDGRFNVPRVPTGPLTISVRRVGYAPKQVMGLYLHENETILQDVSLSVADVEVATVSVTAAAERGSVSAALDAQRTATGVVSSVTAEAIAKSPDGDAAQAVKRVSGVTMQDGKFPEVRGLGGRYTTSSLNGARLPSPEPEQRTVPMDMFPAGLLQSVTTSKTFTPDQQGDFTGALIDIRTKEFPVHRTGVMQVGSGYSAGATGASLLTATSTGGESMAMVNTGRSLPQNVRNLGSFQGVSLTQPDINLLVSSFRDSWTPRPSTAAPLMNGSASFGGNDPVLFGHRLGYLVSGSVSSGTDVKDHQRRALADRGNTPGSTTEIDRFDGQTVSQGVLWGGLANLSTMFGEGTRFTLNSLFNRSADNDARVERGEFTSDAIRTQLSRMQYVQREMRSAQFAGEHQLTSSQRIDYTATFSGVRRYEPDRSEFVQVIDQATPGGPEVLRWLSGGSGGAVRTYSDLTEHSSEYAAKYEISVGPEASRTVIKIGGLTRGTSRDAQSIAYAITAANAPNSLRELTPEQIFDGRFAKPADSVFTLAPLSQGGSYAARDHLRAGFAMADVPLGGAVHLIAGARYESDHLEVDATSTLGSPVVTRKVWNDVLPSLALNVRLAEWQQLRFSATRTLARPEYRELSPIISRDVIGGENVRGDESLERTNVSNADLRWEWYPAPEALLSVGIFVKKFERPIERVYGSGSGGTSFVFFTNARSADNYGAELEVRHDLAFINPAFATVTLFGNATVMESRIHLFDSTQAAATNLSRRMVGQAPYVLNAGLSYASSAGASATLMFNRVGERITTAGSIPLPDVIEQPRNVVDISLRLPVSRGVSIRADAKNLLDAPYSLTQGTVTREYYRSGRVVQAGIVWHP